MAEVIIDIHTHLFGITVEQLLSEAGRAGVRQVVSATVEVNLPALQSSEALSRLKQRFQESPLWHRTLAGMWSFQQVENFLQELASAKLLPTNQELAELTREYPHKLIGFGSLDPNGDEDYIEGKLEEIDALGLHGIKLLPTFQFFNPSRSKGFELICQYCEKSNKPILYHTGCDPGPFEIPELSEDARPKYLAPVLEKYHPRIILAHLGAYSALQPGIWLEEGLELMKRYENVYADTSAVSHLVYTERNVGRIREVGIERILFGSDYPTVSGSDIKYEVELIKNCSWLTEEEKDKILGLNAAKLLQLPV